MTAKETNAFIRLLKRQTRSKSGLGQKGFTLIEAMLISAMLGFTILTVTSMQVQRMRLVKSARERKQVQSVQNSIANAAAQAGAITATEELMFDDTLPLASPSPPP